MHLRLLEEAEKTEFGGMSVGSLMRLACVAFSNDFIRLLLSKPL